MKYLLDTDICSYLIKKNHRHHKPILNQLTSKKPHEVGISLITICEIQSGLCQIPDDAVLKRRRIKQAFLHFISAIEIVEFDLHCALLYGDIRAQLKKSGEDIGAMDCLVAATAISHQLILVSNNHKHFTRIKGLKTENWVDVQVS